MHAMKRTHGKNNTDSVCRLCSSDSGIIVLNIFDGEGKKRRILSLINSCLPVKVHEDDPLPKVICHHCLHKLEVFREFQESCLKSEVTLRNSVSHSSTLPELKSRRVFVYDGENMVPQFSAEPKAVRDPLLPQKLATAIPTPAEEDTDDCVAAVKRDDFEHSLSSQVEVVVKEEPVCKKTETEDESKWLDSSQEEDNALHTEEAEVNLLPPDDINTAICSTPVIPPVISHSIFGHYSSWEDEVQGNTQDMRKKYAKHGRPLGVPEEIRFSDVGSHLPDRLSSFRRCRFCSTAIKQKRSRYQCSSCLVGLCITPCFKKFHEKVPDAT